MLKKINCSPYALIGIYLLKANKKINNRYDHRTLNKITRSLELFMDDYCNGECKELAKIIENTRNPIYIMNYLK